MGFEQKYEVVKKLEAGGMAEVFIARAKGIAGITKTVAIKRVLPHLSENKKFVDMFLDEARVGMKLSHANVVQTFDVGETEGAYFIVMEFVDGVSLRGVLDAFKPNRRVMPVATATLIIAEAARGLAYAHKAADDTGKPLNIVHRDVSPPNILLSRQGEVKVTDFGLAKAASQLEKTDPGVVKGKFSYLCPEAVDGLEVDHRADIFSLGIVLFELLTGRRLFYGETDYQTVQLVQRAHVPSMRLLNPNVPPLLDDVCHKALVRDREWRYQTADEFAEALTSFLYTSGLKATSRGVADVVAEARGYGGVTASERLASKLIQEELLGDLGQGAAARAQSSTDVGSDSVDTRDWMADLGLDDMGDEEAPPPPEAQAGPSDLGEAPKPGDMRKLFGGGPKES